MTTSHTPGPWLLRMTPLGGQLGFSYKVDLPNGAVALTSSNDDASEANAHLIAAAPRLLRALEISEQAIEEATDILHYEDGLPVTALDGSEIERAYTALCSVLVEVHQAITAARGEKP